MTGKDLREARKRRGWTQQQAAACLHVSQAYLSMMERNRRKLPAHRVEFVMQIYDLLPLALPLRGSEAWPCMDVDELAAELASLGYPGFLFLKRKPTWNPAELLVMALTRDNLDSRIVEALPWLVLAYSNMDWEWVVREAKVNDVQNRLGFVVTLARKLAQKNKEDDKTEELRAVELRLHGSVLAREQTLCHEQMSQAERKWLRQNSTPEAKQWNVLSDLSEEHLTHAA